MPDPLRGLHAYHYVLFDGKKRVRDLTFYAESQREADDSARAWAKPRGRVMRRKQREARKS